MFYVCDPQNVWRKTVNQDTAVTLTRGPGSIWYQGLCDLYWQYFYPGMLYFVHHRNCTFGWNLDALNRLKRKGYPSKMKIEMIKTTHFSNPYFSVYHCTKSCFKGVEQHGCFMVFKCT